MNAAQNACSVRGAQESRGTERRGGEGRRGKGRGGEKRRGEERGGEERGEGREGEGMNTRPHENPCSHAHTQPDALALVALVSTFQRSQARQP